MAALRVGVRGDDRK